MWFQSYYGSAGTSSSLERLASIPRFQSYYGSAGTSISLAKERTRPSFQSYYGGAGTEVPHGGVVAVKVSILLW